MILSSALLFSLALTFTACKKDDDDDTMTTTPTPEPTLYSRVGGTTLVQDPNAAAGTMIEQGRLTLRAVVDSSIFVIAGDPVMQPYFSVLLAEVGSGNLTGFSALSLNFTDFLCTATGATNSSYQYTGRSMANAHNPANNSRIAMKVTSADFDQFVNDIGAGLAQNGVTSANNADLVNDLVALLYTTKSAIVQQ